MSGRLIRLQVAATSLVLAACASSPTPTPVAPTMPQLGTLDLDSMEIRFDVELARAAIEEDRIRYVGEVGKIYFDFVVDPPEDGGAIVRATLRNSDVRVPAAAPEAAVISAWFDFIAERRPDAAAWLREEYDGRVDGDGAEYSSDQFFGDFLVAGIFATNLPPELDDDLESASIVEMFVETPALEP